MEERLPDRRPGVAATPLVLASQSPQRSALIARLHLDVTIRPSEVDEAAATLPAEPTEQVRLLARMKAVDVARRHPDRLVLGADTLVALDGQALGKPGTAGAATAMLRRLAGRAHSVHTGLALVVPAGYPAATDGRPTTLSATVSSVVTFRPLDEEQIAAYVQSGEPLDKAGAYGIQGLGSRLVAGLDGCFTNVVGLPLCAVAALLTTATGRAMTCPGDSGCRIGGEYRCHCAPD